MTGGGIEEEMDSYRERLHPNDRERFDEQYNEALEKLDLSEIRDELKAEYQNSESHLELVVATASGFHHTPIAGGYDSGYRFAFTEPLEEQNELGDEGVKNGDVLLIREEDDHVYLCIVECKSGECGQKDWVTELKDIEEVIESNGYKDILKSQLNVEDKSIRDVQYVLLGEIAQIVSMDYDRLNKETEVPDKYAFWGYAIGSQSLVHIHGRVRDHQLQTVIGDTIDAGIVQNSIRFTFSDHPLTQLKVLISKLIKIKKRNDDKHPFEFTREEFTKQCNKELQVGFTGSDHKRLVTNKIGYLLDLGIDICIFTNSSSRLSSGREYRILFRGAKANIAKRAVETKYFEWKSDQRYKRRAFQNIRDNFTPEQMLLDDWLNESE